MTETVNTAANSGAPVLVLAELNADGELRASAAGLLGAAATVALGSPAPIFATVCTHHANGSTHHSTGTSSPPGKSDATAAMSPSTVTGPTTGATSTLAPTETSETLPAIIATMGMVARSAATATARARTRMSGQPVTASARYNSG